MWQDKCYYCKHFEDVIFDYNIDEYDGTDFIMCEIGCPMDFETHKCSGFEEIE